MVSQKRVNAASLLRLELRLVLLTLLIIKLLAAASREQVLEQNAGKIGRIVGGVVGGTAVVQKAAGHE